MTLLKKPVRRVTNSLCAKYGADQKKRLVVTIICGPGGSDMLELRPEGTRRVKRASLSDIYNWLVRCEANMAVGARLAAAKAKKAKAREDRRWAAEIRKAKKEGA